MIAPANPAEMQKGRHFGDPSQEPYFPNFQKSRLQSGLDLESPGFQ
jgi:hypothetical protein